MSAYSVIVAGSTERTLLCARSLFVDPRFKIVGVLTPSPKPIGRKKIVTKNPMHQWAEETGIPVVLIEKKIDSSIESAVHTSLPTADFLLVVDFGYIVPQWLLDLPLIGPINIHPSDLPRWRGSSPGQFVLIFGEKESAVTIMVMDALLDHGAIIAKLPFAVDPMWTALDYYTHAFALVTKRLPEILISFAHDPTLARAQPDISPTPTARMLVRDDGFVPYQTLTRLLANDKGQMTHDKLIEVPFLENYKLITNNYKLYDLWRGLSPWPGLWTRVDDQRMKLLHFHMDGEQLLLDEVQIEGEKSKKY